MSYTSKEMNFLPTGRFFGETSTTLRLEDITLTDTEYTVKHVDWHYHENPYFTFILDGNIVEGNKRSTHNCSAGTLLFHNWQEPHYNVKPEGYTRGFQIEVNADWFRKFELELKDLPSYIKIENPQVKINFHNLYKETKLTAGESDLAIEALLVDSFVELEDSYLIAETKKPAWIRKIDEMIREGFTESISLTDLSNELNLHPAYLCRTFRKFFGCSFGQYSRRLKVERSLVLLRDNSLSLTEISLASGFADQSHFIRCFKSFSGCTPKEFRRSISE